MRVYRSAKVLLNLYNAWAYLEVSLVFKQQVLYYFPKEQLIFPEGKRRMANVLFATSFFTHPKF